MRVRFVVLLGLVAVGLPAQAEWILEHHSPVSAEAQSRHAMAYDAARERVVLFGGSRSPTSTTWKWDGTGWSEHLQANGPNALTDHAMVYNVARARVMLFGGLDSNSGVLAETWVWDGSLWSPRLPPINPPARSHHALAYNSATGRVLLFGGSDGTNGMGDTWEWDGFNWAERFPTNSPGMRHSHSMVYDASRDRVVLFGGLDANSDPLSETWEWLGTNWVQRAPASSPPARSDHALAYDAGRGRVILFGGSAGGPSGDTWEWDGTDWLRRMPSPSPSPRQDHAMAHDSARGQTILFGGWDADQTYSSDTWAWDGNTWTQRGIPSGPLEGVTSYPSIAFDSLRGVSVLVGGTGPTGVETWEWDGETWVEREPSTIPPARWSAAMAYDSDRERTILFGGLGPGDEILSDTWEWDGTDWTEMFPTTVPRRRHSHDMVYDAARNCVVLFGGRDDLPETAKLSDTWEWDGADWLARSSATAPSARYNHTMAYDSVRNLVVLFGGGVHGELTDTWEWDGEQWFEITPFNRPPTGIHHSMAFDVGRNRTVLVDGTIGVPAALRNTWEWNGLNWFRQTTTSPPAPAAVTYDSARERIVLFRGWQRQFDTWEYVPHNPARFSNLGTSCAGTVGEPVLASRPGHRPWIGEEITLVLSPLPPGALNVSFGILGLSNTSWGPIALPQQLTTLGMLGCTQYVSIDVRFTLVTVGGIARWEIDVPDDPGLAGLPFYVQGLVMDSGANPAGFIATNAMEGVIGIR